MRAAMRFSLVALVPAIGLCLSKAIEGRIHPRHNDAFKGDSKSICVTYVNTYLSTLEPRGSTNTGEKNPIKKSKTVTARAYMMESRIARATASSSS